MRDMCNKTFYLAVASGSGTKRAHLKHRQMILIGLTGNIASGKSEVAKMLEDRGATLIDADVLAREAVEPDTQALKDIVKR